MNTKFFISIITLATLLAACAPKNGSTPVPTMAPVMTEAMESMEPTSAPTEVASVTSAPTEVTSTTSAPLLSGNIFEVEISGFAFKENTITIKIGDTVTWTNHDSAPHTIVANDGSFKSSTLSNDATFSQTFGSAGTFPYQCGIHSSMTGTVIVQP